MNTRKHELQYRPELRHYLLPTLVYYLKLIELPNLELETYIRQELETNPLLEELQQEPEASDDTESTETQEEKIESQDNSEKEAEDVSLLELFSEDSNINYEAIETQFDPFDNVPAHEDKLYDKLMNQARTTFNEHDLEIAEIVIANIEDDGYLAATPEEIAGEEFTIDDVLAVIKKIQRFEPIGCAWRDTREPLLIQLEELGYGHDSLEQILVRDCLKDLKGNHIKDIMKKLQIDEKRLLKARTTIMKLDPKPGWRYSSIPSRYITPDFVIAWRENQLCASLNEDTPTRIRVRRQYIDMMKHRAKIPKEDREFIRQKMQSAQNLILAIEQRRRTLTRIINSILEYQREFFEKGYNYLKPVTMTDFARQLNVNPSTVSRALANKYLESPWGIHKLKFFFAAPVGQSDKRLIFKKIKDIVEAEDKSAPLSDIQIVKKLSRDGIIISRRTVSKYRDVLKIPAHQFRRT